MRGWASSYSPTNHATNGRSHASGTTSPAMPSPSIVSNTPSPTYSISEVPGW